MFDNFSMCLAKAFIFAIAWGAAFPSLTSAGPVLENGKALLERQTSSCDPTSPTALTPDCWTTLGMESYIKQWLTDNGGKCDNLGFAQCFLKFNKHPEMTCDSITVETCSPPDAAGNWDSPQQFLAVWNIYAIHQYFNQYYTAIGDAHLYAADKVDAIVGKVTPPHGAGVDGRQMSFLLAASFGMFGVAKEFMDIFKAMWVGMTVLAGTAAQVANYMDTESGTNFAKEFMLIADMKDNLGNVILKYQGGIATMVRNIQKDSEKFLKLCSAGGFSQRISTSLPEDTKSIFDPLVLYILSTVMSANNIVISKSPKTNPQTVAKTTDKVHCPGFDQYNTCYEYWYDIDSDTTYTITNLKNNAGNDYWDLTHTIWTQGWATPSTFFLGSDKCGSSGLHMDNNGVLQCVSNIPTCTAANAVFDVRKDYPEQFTDCPNAEYWLEDVGGEFVFALCVPKSYLGPEITDPAIEVGCNCDRIQSQQAMCKTD